MERTDYENLSQRALLAIYNDRASGIKVRRAILAEARRRGMIPAGIYALGPAR